MRDTYNLDMLLKYIRSGYDQNIVIYDPRFKGGVTTFLIEKMLEEVKNNLYHYFIPESCSTLDIETAGLDRSDITFVKELNLKGSLTTYYKGLCKGGSPFPIDRNLLVIGVGHNTVMLGAI